MPTFMQRKYIDLIREASSKWANWNPPIGIPVGAYGTVDKETGELQVEGNIYDPEFQMELDKQDVKFNLADYPPQKGPVESDFVVSSRRAKQRDLDVDNELDIPGIATASIKGQWSFQSGKRDAFLIMHNPRQIFLPPNVVLEHLYKVDKLIDKWLVTSVHVCPAYTMYLSDKVGDKVSLALVADAPVAAAIGVTASASHSLYWAVKAQTGILRKGCDESGNDSFTPLYSLRRPIKRNRRWIRDTIKPEPTGDDLWFNDSPPWDPLDEDGEEDLFDPSVTAVDPFKHVNEAAAAAAST